MRKAFFKQVKFLERNLHHPSLHARKFLAGKSRPIKELFAERAAEMVKRRASRRESFVWDTNPKRGGGDRSRRRRCKDLRSVAEKPQGAQIPEVARSSTFEDSQTGDYTVVQLKRQEELTLAIQGRRTRAPRRESGKKKSRYLPSECRHCIRAVSEDSLRHRRDRSGRIAREFGFP